MPPSPSRLSRFVFGFGIVLLYFPLVTLMLLSFKRAGIADSEWTLQWYRQALSNAEILAALERSFAIGLLATCGAVMLGLPAALAIERSRFPGRKVLNELIQIPLVMPEIVMGLSLLVWLVLLRMTLGFFSIVLAHISFSVSYVIITIQARLQGFDHSLEEAARDLGANRWQAFWRVTFPLIWPGVLSGALMAFTLSFDDFLVTFFTAGVGSDTLPLKIYSMVKFGVSPEVNAVSTLMLVATFALASVVFRPFQFQKRNL